MITKEIDLIYQFKKYNHIQVTKDARVFNTKTGREKKVCRNCRSFGIWLTPKIFVPVSKINQRLELIPETNIKDLISQLTK